MRKYRIIIIDAYIDEPSCLGVPPYLSPYPRYIAALIETKDSIAIYRTIDDLRKNNYKIEEEYDYAIVIAGTTVPGRYIGGLPATLNELTKIAKNKNIILGGPISILFRKDLYKNFKGYDFLLYNDLYSGFSYLFHNNFSIPHGLIQNYPLLNPIRYGGNHIFMKMKNYPYIICEIETFTGCVRDVHCSYCSEALHSVKFSPIENIINEIKDLYSIGFKYFRIGKQSDFFSFQADLKTRIHGFTKPNPFSIYSLMKGIRESCPNIKMLNIDNTNPNTLAYFPHEASQIANTIVKFNTPGDIAAMGIESFDPIVSEANFLHTKEENVLKACSIINKASYTPIGYLPKFLPGINLLYGLKRETEDTFKINFNALKRITNKGILLRRINIRQVRKMPNTPLFTYKKSKFQRSNYYREVFKYFKNKIRKEIELPNLKKIVPQYSILKEVFTEKYKGDFTLSRQFTTYPLTVRIPTKLPLINFFDIMITDYGERSLVGVPIPININKADYKLLKALPGIGRKNAYKIIEKRPFRNYAELIDIIDDKSLQILKPVLIFQ